MTPLPQRYRQVGIIRLELDDVRVAVNCKKSRMRGLQNLLKRRGRLWRIRRQYRSHGEIGLRRNRYHLESIRLHTGVHVVSYSLIGKDLCRSLCAVWVLDELGLVELD